MRRLASNIRCRTFGLGKYYYAPSLRKALVAVVSMALLALALLEARRVEAGTNPSASSAAPASPVGAAQPLAETLGVHFVPGSSSTLLLERDGKTYVIDLAAQTIQQKDPPGFSPVVAAPQMTSAHSSTEDNQLGAKTFADKCAQCHGAEGRGIPAMRTPDFTNPAVQAGLTEASVRRIIRNGKKGTAMPAWGGKISDAEILAVTAFVRSLGPAKAPDRGAANGQAKQAVKAYQPADDYLFSLPTGRRLDRHGFYLNFTHRFAYNPAFSGTGLGDTLFGLDGFSISSFGLRYGITNKLSISAYRSPSLMGRPIELMVAYNLLDEHDGYPLNAAVRFSVDGQGNFSKNFTTNFEGIFSRSVTRHAQMYFVPTLSLQNRELIQKPGSLAMAPPSLPGFNTFSLGVGAAVDIRPSVAIVSEVFPTLVNGPVMGIHRPAFAFGIQKRVLRHAFTFGFSNSPGTVVSQRAGTRATFLGDPSADTGSGLFIGFDLMRQIY